MTARKFNRSLSAAPSAHRPCPALKRSYPDRQAAERAAGVVTLMERAAVARFGLPGVSR